MKALLSLWCLCAFVATTAAQPLPQVLPKRNIAITVAWDASPDPEVVSYVIYVGTNSGVYTRTVETTGLTAVVDRITPGVTYYLAATGKTKIGVESEYSVEITYGHPAPAPPQLRVTKTEVYALLQRATNSAGPWTTIKILETNTFTAGVGQEFFRTIPIIRKF